MSYKWLVMILAVTVGSVSFAADQPQNGNATGPSGTPSPPIQSSSSGKSSSTSTQAATAAPQAGQSKPKMVEYCRNNPC